MTVLVKKYNKISLSSKMVLGIMKLTYKITGKKMLNVAFSMKRKDFKVPQLISKKYKGVYKKISNNDIATIIPDKQESDLHIIYFHGGAYIAQGSIIHWLLIAKIIDAVNCKITYIDYPLAPEANYKDTFSMVKDAYKQLLVDYSSDNFVFAGDSAGGGLSLAFAQSVKKDKNLKTPIGLILLSPWLDLSMKNKDISYYEDKDVVLSSKLLIEAAQKYSGGDDTELDLLSPINGSMDGLGSILLMSGTSEIFFPDCEKLMKEAESANVSLEFSTYKEMPHTWVLFYFKESKPAIVEITEFLNRLKKNI
ncbi:MAG: alpha/beta hydrolase [Clostridiales bacterium]|nr:alpha/beta hydrolase [Clostridiales bacterium]